MAPTSTSGSASDRASVQQFLRTCDLDLDQPRDAQLYDMMRQECIAGLQSVRDAAAETERSLPIGEISEDTLRRAISNIFTTASPETRQVYSRGQSQHDDNWIIRWLVTEEVRNEEAPAVTNHVT